MVFLSVSTDTGVLLGVVRHCLARRYCYIQKPTRYRTIKEPGYAGDRMRARALLN